MDMKLTGAGKVFKTLFESSNNRIEFIKREDEELHHETHGGRCRRKSEGEMGMNWRTLTGNWALQGDQSMSNEGRPDVRQSWEILRDPVNSRNLPRERRQLRNYPPRHPRERSDGQESHGQRAQNPHRAALEPGLHQIGSRWNESRASTSWLERRQLTPSPLPC
jgi:hypothetical protein